MRSWVRAIIFLVHGRGLRSALLLLSVVGFALVFIAAEAPAPPLGAGLRIEPAYRRIELPADGATTAVVMVRADRAAVLLAGTSECPCVHLTTPTPVTLPAGQDVALSLSVSGLLPGIKTVALRTSIGVIEVRVQVVSQGRGEGAAVWAELQQQAQANGWAATVLIHDLHGTVRNCGCSGGSLGGINILAGLAGLVRDSSRLPTPRLVLSGDVDGQRLGVGAALQEYGWQVNPADVVVRASAAEIATVAASELVITSDLSGPEHARLVRAPPTSGIAAVVLLRDASGAVRHRALLPIDRTLPSEAAILARFPDVLTGTLLVEAPDSACATCHPGAQAAWAGSRHAHALNSLLPTDRTDACIACHATGTPDSPTPQWTGGVQCSACHQGTAEHVRANGAVRTGGAVACAACHDSKHHPSFDRVGAWARIEHGR